LRISVLKASKAGHQIGRHQSLLDPHQDAVFEFVAAYQQPIRAGTLRSVRCAAVAVTADDGIAAATRAADQQTTQEKLPPVHAVERIAAGVTADLQAQLFLACLDPLPERIIDDAQMRNLSDLPLCSRIGPRDTLDAADIDSVLADFAREPNGGLIVTPSPLTATRRDVIIASAARLNLPAIYSFRFSERRANLIRDRPTRNRARSSVLRQSHLAWRETRRSAGTIADKISAGNQSQDRQRSGLKAVGIFSTTRRRGDRITSQCPLLAQSGHAGTLSQCLL
jgi:hypothetical protein